MQEPDDVQLMERFRAGDRSAMEALVDRHHGALIRYFFVQSRSRETAEDLAQEVWVRVVRHREDYEARARFQTYLFHIARNLWIDRYRSLRAAPREVSADAEVASEDGGEGSTLAALLPGREQDPGERASVSEEADRVRAEVERLPEDLRAVFELGEVREMRYADVSRILGIPVGTVKSRMHAAMLRLRAVLAPRSEETRKR